MARKEKQIRQLKICHWNANGIKEKASDLEHFMAEHDVDIMLLNETKLMSNKKPPYIQGFKHYRRDRPGRDHNKNPGGGVMIYVKTEIKAQELLPTINSDMEVIGIKTGQITIYSIYAPDNTLDAGTLDQLFNSGRRVVLLGDFNSKHTSWQCNTNNSNGIRLFNYMLKNDRYGLLTPTEFTHYSSDNDKNPSIIDVGLIKNINNVNLKYLMNLTQIIIL